MNCSYIFKANKDIGLGHFSRGLSLQRSGVSQNVKMALIHLGKLSPKEHLCLMDFSTLFGSLLSSVNQP